MADQRAASRTPRHHCVRVMSRVSDLKCDLHKSFHEFEYRNSVQDRSMLVVLLLLSPFLFQAPSVDCKALPRGLAVFLERMGIPRDEFLRRYKAYNTRASAISARHYDVSTSFRTTSDVPEHSEGVITTELNNIPYLPFNAHCHPRPAIIELPRVFGTSLFPSFVILHRCGGSCSLEDAQHCAVTAQDAINVQVLEIIKDKWVFKSMKLYNHTHCNCDCIQTASSCVPVRQIWNKDYCKCDCNGTESQCDAATQSWDSNACACKCDTAPQICAHNKEWDTENCGCHCKKYLQDQCTANNQNIDTGTCKCLDVNAL